MLFDTKHYSRPEVGGSMLDLFRRLLPSDDGCIPGRSLAEFDLRTRGGDKGLGGGLGVP